MICKKPFFRGRIPFGCGQCLPCRINRGRQWTWRQFLESLTHNENCFLTLTYRDEDLPANNSLRPRDLQLFLKRLRKRIAPHEIRFFAVGEYGHEGTRGWNPHYHLSLFGVSGLSIFDGVSFGRICEEEWGFGFAPVYEFNHHTAAYVCGYVTKKLTRPDDERLEGRHPEFARMSRRPGIGWEAMRIVAREIVKHGSISVLEETGDVGRTLLVGQKKLPLGRYLLARLREQVGFTPEYIRSIKERLTYGQSLEMCAVLENALSTTSTISARSAFLQEAEGRIAATEARAEMYKARKRL